MMRNFVLLLAATALLGCVSREPSPGAPDSGSPEPDASVSAWIVESARGTVEIRRPGAEWGALAKGDAAGSGSSIRTGVDGEADLCLDSGIAVRLKPGAEIAVREIGGRDGSGPVCILVLRGRVLHRFDAIPRGFEYRLATPVMGAVCDSGLFEIEVDAGRTRLSVLEGRVDLSAAGGVARVERRQSVEILAGEAPRRLIRLTRREIRRLRECEEVGSGTGRGQV